MQKNFHLEFDAIIESYINGQKKQMVEQIEDLPPIISGQDKLSAFIEYCESNRIKDTLSMLKTYFNLR